MRTSSASTGTSCAILLTTGRSQTPPTSCSRSAGRSWDARCSALRAVPVIAVTSYALSGDETKALAAGADAYVSKPFSPRALLAKVREFLG